jgi:hypothetical protein
MFVPCDEDGNVLEEPVKEDYYVPMGEVEYHRVLKQYQQAKERVLFEDITNGLSEINIEYHLRTFKTIEDAINAGVKLKLKGWR